MWSAQFGARKKFHPFSVNSNSEPLSLVPLQFLSVSQAIIAGCFPLNVTMNLMLSSNSNLWKSTVEGPGSFQPIFRCGESSPMTLPCVDHDWYSCIEPHISVGHPSGNRQQNVHAWPWAVREGLPFQAGIACLAGSQEAKSLLQLWMTGSPFMTTVRTLSDC